jgi:hypothetical protein
LNNTGFNTFNSSGTHWDSSPSNKKIPLTIVSFAGKTFFFTTHVSEPTISSSLPRDAKEISHLHGDQWSTNNAVTSDHNYSPQKDQLLGISDIVNFVQTSLGLPKKAIAEIFDVTRQTLHSYSKSDDPDSVINDKTRRRAHELSKVMHQVSPLFKKSPGAMVKNFFLDGNSLFDLLTHDELDHNKIMHIASQLANKIALRPITKPALDGDTTLDELTRHT